VSAFDRLHPAIQYHVVNCLGWRSLRALQEEAIEPILTGEHALLLAPTGGRKTEAAMFPLLSRMLAENWSRRSVLYYYSATHHRQTGHRRTTERSIPSLRRRLRRVFA